MSWNGWCRILCCCVWKGRGGWLTPVEIFRPWYGIAIAQHILQLYAPQGGPLKIVEIGGGSGTCMVDVMRHIQQAEPLLFKDVRHTNVVGSSRSCEVVIG